MKVNKVQAILFIFKELLEKGHINKKNIQNTILISDLSFRRYIQELRAYLINFNEPYEIVYNKQKDSYYLEKVL